MINTENIEINVNSDSEMAMETLREYQPSLPGLDFMLMEDNVPADVQLNIENQKYAGATARSAGSSEDFSDEACSETLIEENEEVLEHEVLDQGLHLSGAPQDNLSLPAVLCDELLIKEIQSIPDKMAFKIGDVADLLGIKQYVLRYWESEFDVLKPKKANNNQRMYTRKDVENAFLIRKLLHRDRFSIEGARNALKELKAHVKKEKDFSAVVNKFETLQEKVDSLITDIQKLKATFR